MMLIRDGRVGGAVGANELWVLIEPLILAAPVRPQGGGISRVDERKVYRDRVRADQRLRVAACLDRPDSGWSDIPLETKRLSNAGQHATIFRGLTPEHGVR